MMPIPTGSLGQPQASTRSLSLPQSLLTSSDSDGHTTNPSPRRRASWRHATQARFQPPAPAIRRIAVVRALRLGDLLVAIPALRTLRAAFPAAEITLIGLPWAEALIERYPRYLDRFVAFPGWPGIHETAVDAQRITRFLEEQQHYGYDLAIQMHGSGRVSNGFTLALGARLTAGYYEGTRPAGLDFAAPYPDGEPEVVRNLGLARLLGCTECSPHLEFPLYRSDRDEAAALLRGDRARHALVGIHPGARSPARRWPVERFAAVADALADRYGARVVLLGGPDEIETARAVAARMVNRPLVLAGHTSLGGLAAVISALDLFIGNDTGPAHLAEAVGTPSVTVFGPADAHRWAPLNGERHPIVRVPVGCSPCGHWACPIDHGCLGRVTPEMVVEAAESLLRTGARACNA